MNLVTDLLNAESLRKLEYFLSDKEFWPSVDGCRFTSQVPSEVCTPAWCPRAACRPQGLTELCSGPTVSRPRSRGLRWVDTPALPAFASLLRPRDVYRHVRGAESVSASAQFFQVPVVHRPMTCSSSEKVIYFRSSLTKLKQTCHLPSNSFLSEACVCEGAGLGDYSLLSHQTAFTLH